MTKKNRNIHGITYYARQSFVSSRPISWINTAFPFAAGYLATGGALSPYFFVATFYFLIPYNFLIYVVNDVYDYESDVRNPRKNSIEGGLLPPETHRTMIAITTIFNSVFLAYLLLFGTVTSNVMLAVIVFAAISYSVPHLRFKEKPFLDSLNSSFHFFSPLVFALLLTGWSNSCLLYVAAFLFWGSASHAFGAVQDIKADREAKIASIATYLGARNTVRLSLGLYLAATVFVALCGWPAIIVCIPLLAYALMVLPFIDLTDSDAEKANKGWRKFLLLNQFAGFVVTIILIISKIS